MISDFIATHLIAHSKQLHIWIFFLTIKLIYHAFESYFSDNTAELIVRELFIFLKENLDFGLEQDDLIQRQLLDQREKEDHICKDQCKAFWSERYLKLSIMKKRCNKFFAFIHDTPSHRRISCKIISREIEEMNKSNTRGNVIA